MIRRQILSFSSLCGPWRFCSEEENRDNSNLVVSAPSYLLHSQKQVYKLIGKCQIHSKLVKHTLTFPVSETDERIGSKEGRSSFASDPPFPRLPSPSATRCLLS
ncbi:hypothetical protein PAMP_020548 [Pampus punctatissimus]